VTLDHIFVDQAVLDGLPCVHPTRVPVAVVTALAADGMPAEEIAGRFSGLTVQGVHQALAMPAWMTLPPGGLTAAQYDELPEDVCSYIEVVDGTIVARS
jgi:uncharacterized protein (DUF433 family)